MMAACAVPCAVLDYHVVENTEPRQLIDWLRVGTESLFLFFFALLSGTPKPVHV